MEVLIRLPKELSEQNLSPNELAETLHKQVCQLYNESVSDSEAYIQSIPAGVLPSRHLELVAGTIDPESIKSIGQSWNDTQSEAFTRAIKNVYEHAGRTSGQTLWHTAPKTDIYVLKKAAMALDDDFYDFADRALLVDKYGRFTTILTADEICEITEHPEQFACITVYPK